MPMPLETISCFCGKDTTSGVPLACRDDVSGEQFRYVTCAACGAQRLNPRPDRDAIGGYYPVGYASHIIRPQHTAARIKHLIYLTFYAPDNRLSWRRPLLRALLWPVRGHCSMAFDQVEPHRVFEFGAATGNDLVPFHAEGWQVAGCEPSPRACAIAAARGIALQCTPAETATLPPTSVSAVLINNVLEHVHDPEAVLTKAWQGLVPGGSLVVIVPNHAGPAARLFPAAWPGYDAPRHLWGFTPASLTALLDRAGFPRPTIHQMFQGRWAWQGSLEGSRAATSPSAWRRRHARWLSLAFLPFGILTALFGRGDFMTVVARKPLD